VSELLTNCNSKRKKHSLYTSLRCQLNQADIAAGGEASQQTTCLILEYKFSLYTENLTVSLLKEVCLWNYNICVTDSTINVFLSLRLWLVVMLRMEERKAIRKVAADVLN